MLDKQIAELVNKIDTLEQTDAHWKQLVDIINDNYVNLISTNKQVVKSVVGIIIFKQQVLRVRLEKKH